MGRAILDPPLLVGVDPVSLLGSHLRKTPNSLRHDPRQTTFEKTRVPPRQDNLAKERKVVTDDHLATQSQRRGKRLS